MPVDELPRPDGEPWVPWILEQLARLPRAQREVLHLRYGEGLTPSAIGERLGIGQSAASRRVSKAVATLRRRARCQGLLSQVLPPAWAASLAGAPWMKILALAVALGLGATVPFSLSRPTTRLVPPCGDGGGVGVAWLPAWIAHAELLVGVWRKPNEARRSTSTEVGARDRRNAQGGR